MNIIEPKNKFIIDRIAINNEWKSPKYDNFRKWYWENYNEAQHQFIKTNYYKHLDEIRFIIPFAQYVLEMGNILETSLVKDYFDTVNKSFKHGNLPTESPGIDESISLKSVVPKQPISEETKLIKVNSDLPLLNIDNMVSNTNSSIRYLSPGNTQHLSVPGSPNSHKLKG